MYCALFCRFPASGMHDQADGYDIPTSVGVASYHWHSQELHSQPSRY